MFLVQLSFALYLLDILIPVPITASLKNGNTCKKPHIIFIVADDLGWNDVSFHGSDQIPTPNIDALAYNGVILQNHYTLPLCTPSRSALLTGKYPIRTGMQHYVIPPSGPWGLPLNETLISQYLKEGGYATRIVGKWHLGFYKHEYTPTYRGFDTHYGYWNGLQDYWTQQVNEPYTCNKGKDMRRNMEVDYSTEGKYSTNIFTEEAMRVIDAHADHSPDKPMFLYLSQIAPHSGNEYELLQAPDEEIQKFSYIEDKDRRTYAAMVSILDQSIGKVVKALGDRDMLENSIIVFMSDNGAPTYGFLANHGSNYPLRGIKNTPWEGGVRVPAVIWSPRIKCLKRVSKDLMHTVDWLPTLLTAACMENVTLDRIDGLDMWPAIASCETGLREEVLINIDDADNYEAIRRTKYKYIRSQSTSNSDWVGDSGKNSSEKRPPYSPETVLRSEVGVAIATVMARYNTSLNSQEILNLRRQTEIYCNITDTEPPLCTKPCLFDLERDPCEKENIIEQEPLVAKQLQDAILKYRENMVPPNNKFVDWEASPFWWNNTWICWKDPGQQHTNIFVGIIYSGLYVILPLIYYFLNRNFK